MSTKGIEALWERAIEDDDFSKLLFTNPQQAISGYELTPEEAAMFIDTEQNERRELLETRTSFSLNFTVRP